MISARMVLIVIVTLSTITSCTRETPQHHATPAAPDTTAHTAQDYYTCTMHPFVHSDKPGPCPVCGMPMVRKSVASAAMGELDTTINAVRFSPSQRALANVQTIVAERRALANPIAVVGVVDIAEPLRGTVSSRVRGRIEALHANVTGMVVHKGETLYEVYSPELVASSQDYLLALDANAAAPNAVARQMLDAAREKLHGLYGFTDTQIASLESSHRPSTRVAVIAPISGTILRKDIIEGMYVSEGTTMLEIANLSTVWVWMDVYEVDMAHIHAGQGVTVETDAYPGESFKGKISFIDPILNPATRTVRVRAEFVNPAQRLKPQMYVRAVINVPARPALFIPSSAVLQTGVRNVVWVETSTNVFEPREVHLGTRVGSDVEILHGLTAGEAVAVSGGFLIDSESQLTHPNAETHPEHAH